MTTEINTSGLANMKPQTEPEQKGHGAGVRVSKNGPRALDFIEVTVEEIKGDNARNKGKHMLKTASKIVDDDIPSETGGIVYRTFFVEGEATRKTEGGGSEPFDLVENLGYLLYSAGRTEEGVQALGKKGNFDLDAIAKSLTSTELDKVTKQPKNRWYSNLYLKAYENNGKSGVYTEAGQPILREAYLKAQQAGGNRWRKDPVLSAPRAAGGTTTVGGPSSGSSGSGSQEEPAVHVEI